MINVRDLIEKSYDVNVSYYFKQTICQIFKNRDHRVEFHFPVFTTNQYMLTGGVLLVQCYKVLNMTTGIQF